MRRALILSIIDQGLLSAFNLALSLFLIANTTPAEFGLFVVLFAVLFVLLSVQNALILTPLNYLLPGRPADEQRRQLSLLTSINLALLLGAALIGVAVSLVYSAALPLVVATAGALGLGLLREYARNVFVVRDEAGRALVLDAVYVISAACLGLLLWQVSDPVTAALGALGLGSLVALFLVPVRTLLDFSAMRIHWRSYRAVWLETRWALLGAMQTEAQTRGYVFLVEAWRGAASIATLQAGRTILSPLQLVSTAWSRIARPRMTAMVHRGEDGALKLLGQGLLVVGGLSLAYGLLTILMWPQLQALVFRDKYPEMEWVVALWWIHATVLSLNGVVATLLQARRQFRALALIGVATSGFCLAGLLALTQSGLPAIVALGVLIVAELMDMAGQVWLAFRRPSAAGSAVPAE